MNILRKRSSKLPCLWAPQQDFNPRKLLVKLHNKPLHGGWRNVCEQMGINMRCLPGRSKCLQVCQENISAETGDQLPGSFQRVLCIQYG